MLREATYYTAICDLCGADLGDYGDYSAWSSQDGADIEADGSDWWVERGNHICPGCIPTPDFEDAEADDELLPQHGAEGHICYAATEPVKAN